MPPIQEAGLPAEQYLLKHWDWSKPDHQDGGQRQDLIRAFLALDVIPAELDGVGEDVADSSGRKAAEVTAPTPQQFARALEAWRSPSCREAGVRIWTLHSPEDLILLRTHYHEEEEEAAKMESWAGELDWLQCTLDDAEAYNLGSEWHKVLEILPEIARRPCRYARSLHSTAEESFQEAEQLEQRRHDLREVVESATDKRSTAESSEIALELQFAACARLVVVADAQAFEDDTLLLLFLDAQGDVIRQLRADVDALGQDLLPTFFQGHLAEQFEVYHQWDDYDHDDSLGPKYRMDGTAASRVYGLENVLDE